MKKHRTTGSIFFLLVGLLVLPAVGAAQSSPPRAESVPAGVLAGMADFDIAFSFEGDLRGNFGPCG